VRACVCLQGDSLADAETDRQTDTAADRRQADEQYLCFDRSRPPACVPPSARQVPGAGPIARPVGVATAGRPVIVRPFVCSSLLLVLLGYFTASSSHTIAAHVERERDGADVFGRAPPFRRSTWLISSAESVPCRAEWTAEPP